MTPKKVFYGMLGLVALSIIASVFAFRMAQSNLADQALSISDLKAELELVEAQVQVYNNAKTKVEELKDLAGLIDKVLPEEKNQAEVVSQLKQFAQETQTGIRTLEFSTLSDGNTNPNLSQTTAVEGIPGVRALQVNMSLNDGVSYAQFLAFLEKIENNQRKMQVTSVSITPNPEDRNILSSASLQIKVYLKG